uniref:Vesicle transport protein n=1 Tax=Neogobius melanostomus TaxID=47308 RepID=A0A8C6TTR8_9GOBI
IKKFKSVRSGEESDIFFFLQTVNEASSLSWTTRLQGFVVCFIIGVGCTILGIYMLFLPELGLYLFKILYTVGHICLLGSTLFLKGPEEQLKMMFDDTRKVPTSLMLVSAPDRLNVINNCDDLKPYNKILSFEFSRYCLSYIPSARYNISY